MKSFTSSRKFLFGVSVSMVLAMAIGSFALGENQTPVSPQGVEVQSLVGATVGPFTVEGGTQGTDYEFTGTSGTNGVLTIHPQSIETNITISNTGTTTDRIEVTSAATITLAGVNIDRSSITTTEPAALTITDNATFDVKILLADNTTNILKGATGNSASPPYHAGSPGIQKNGSGDGIGTLTIGVPDGSQGTGELEANGGDESAGIGGGKSENASNITINGGVVKAYGGFNGAGIGGGDDGNGSNITINGGVVTANGYFAAGIGGGNYGGGSNITISGGKVIATGGYDGAGIGGGGHRSGSNIKISGGEVTATGGISGAGIGGGYEASGSYITISGDETKVTATGGTAAAGIGGGTKPYGGSSYGNHITITGGVITAIGGNGGAGIGGGHLGSASDNSLNGDAVVMATSGYASKEALEGFDDGQGGSLLTQGIAFTGLGTAFDSDGHATAFSWDESGTMYGNVALSKNLEIPANLTVPAGNTLTINQGVTLKVPTGKTLQNDGTITINNTGTINCQGTITTKTDFHLDDGSLYNTGYQTYQTNVGVQKYKNLPNPYQLDPANGKRLINWYYLDQASQKVAISENINVLLNEHSFHENSIEQFTVTFSVPTGTAPAAQTIDDGSKATDPQLSWADGTVEGWYKDQAFTPANKWNFGTDTVTGNITLYAKFQCTVTFNPNYSGGSSTTGTAVYNKPVAEPTAPTRSGYRFDGWYKESACTNKWTFTTAVTRNTTLYAKWVQQFTVTFNVPTGTAPAAQTVDTGSKATDPQLSWADGTVEGWYKEQSFTNKWNFGTDTVTGNITLYAKFTCSVTFNSQGGSTVAGQTVVYDNTVPEPDEPIRDGYSFVEWCEDEECTTAWDFENDRVQGDMTLYAKWLGNEHNVIIPTNPDDHGTVTTDPENPKTGDEVIITVTPEEGYEIDGLPIVKTEDGRIIEVIPTGNPNEYKFIMPDSDVTIEVNFVLISEPTVDPGVKTGDSFAGFAALAILGVATTGAALLRKRK